MTGKAAQAPAHAGALQSLSRLRINLRQLEVFVATARAGSTRSAADRVARSQSAASAAIADLEATLGAALFDRVRRRLLLNENGRALLPLAASLLDHAAELEHLFTGAHAAPLRVAASLTIGEMLLPELVARWKQSHPLSPVHIRVANTTEVVAAVAAFDCDVGFHRRPADAPRAGRAAVAHRRAGHRPRRSTRSPAARAWPWPTCARRHGPCASRARARARRATAGCWRTWARTRLRAGQHRGAQAPGEGHRRRVSLRHAVAADLARGTLVELRSSLPPLKRRLAIVVHKDKHLGRGADDFLRHCAEAERAGFSPADPPARAGAAAAATAPTT
ncbi:MAG: LysR family transcriptional regulator [Rubrivivax sp.]